MTRPFKDVPKDQLERNIIAARKQIAFDEAGDSLLRYIQLQMVDPERPYDAAASRYDVTPQAKLLCDIMEKVEQGKMKRVAVSIGPQMGKSEIITRSAPAWISGRNPYDDLLIGTYNQTFAEEFGFEVRGRIKSTQHKGVFPQHSLKKGSSDLLITEEGGKIGFVGVGGSGSGKPAKFFLVDDPIRSDDDAQSQVYRDRIWKWFNGVVFARTKRDTAIVIVHTRWNQDDLIGRLCDPDHPERHKEYAGIADRWTYINIPAIIDDPKLAHALGLTLEPSKDPNVVSMFGSGPIAALWESQKPAALMAEAKQLDPRTFNALYMGKPSQDDGDYFKKEWLVEYERDELPLEMRKYGASDHAVSVKQGRDYTVAGCVGIDEKNHIWVLPDIVWERMEADRIVETILDQIQRHEPDLWWLESELISKSFGPFLKKRMLETETFATIEPVLVSKDKRTRARAIQGRMGMKMVHFPRFAPWWPDARKQLLAFDYGANDDFVDFMAHIGAGLLKEGRGKSPQVLEDNVIRIGSPVWSMRQAALRATREKRLIGAKGW